MFKEFSGIDAFAICLNTSGVDEEVNTVRATATGFGRINLEDNAAPHFFEIERWLQEELDIPVFHDDQHGTAVVVSWALINALGKKPESVKVVILGEGAAGTACVKMIKQLKVDNIIACDRKGALHNIEECKYKNMSD